MMDHTSSEQKRAWSVRLLAFLVLACTGVWGILFLRNPSGMQSHVFFSDTNDWFMDFYNTVYAAYGRTPYSWGNLPARNYLPLGYLILYPFAFLYPYNMEESATSYIARYSQFPAIAGAVVLLLWCMFFFYSLYRTCTLREGDRLALLFSFFCSGIMIFNYDRMNELILVAGLIALYLKYYDSDHRLQRQGAVLCLAFAAALKLFPAVLGIFLIYRKRWKEALCAVLYGILLTVLPFFWLVGDPKENLSLFLRNIAVHAQVYADSDIGLNGWYVLKALHPHGLVLACILALIALVVAPFLRERWKQILLIVLLLLMTTTQQGYYCLIYLFVPIVLFFNEGPDIRKIGYVLCFALLLIPLQYDYENAFLQVSNITVSNTLCVCLYLLLIAEGCICMVRTLKSTGRSLPE